MFEDSLSRSLQKIFKAKKVSYDQPGENYEQQCLYIDVQSSVPSMRDGKALFRVSGVATMIGQNSQISGGFFARAIAKADPSDTKPFFFFDIDATAKRSQNLVQRGLSFVYFFEAQNDPETGSMTSVEFD